MITLRVVQPRDVTVLTRWTRDPVAAGEHQWFGYRSGHRLEALVAVNESIGDDYGWLAITDDDDEDDDLRGSVNWWAQQQSPVPSAHTLRIAILLRPEFRGQGIGTAAQRQLAAYLFAHYPVERVDAVTDVDNTAEQRALEKAGFSREGVMRRTQWRQGGWHDLVLYSKLRGES